jgi:hypothetical protein
MTKLKLFSFKFNTFFIFISVIYIRYISILKCTQIKKSKKYTDKDGDINLRDQLLKYEEKMNNHAAEYSAREVSSRELKFFELSQNEILKRSSNNFNTNTFSFSSYLEVSRQISTKDDPSAFLDYKYETNINKLPKQGEVDKKPWSSTYWPTKNGQISVRYNTNSKNSMGKYNPVFDNFTEMYNWNKSLTFYSQPDEYQRLIKTNLNIEKYIAENYSPSEKYDFLLGDFNFTLTNYLKKDALNLGKSYGDIPNWFGICHGWAVASYFYDKPNHEITLLAADKKTKVTFVPEDIKALASLYWANVGYTTNFIGIRCNANKPTSENSDVSTGLYTSDPCFSINPASLLLTLTNHVGINKKNLVLDPMADPEIWNQPLNDYSVSYFNILNNKFFPELSKVKVDKNQIKYSDDSFLKFLNKKITTKTKSLVGVMFNITYTQEIFPYHYSYAIDDLNKTETYVGVVELDEKENIVGGEWKYNAHPNFLWKYDEDHPVEGCCDRMAKAYDGDVTNELKNSASIAAQKGQVIKSIVDYMVKLANQEIESNNTNYLGNNTSVNVSTVNRTNDSISESNTSVYNTSEAPTTFYEPTRSPIEIPVITTNNNVDTPESPSTPVSLNNSSNNPNSNSLNTGASAATSRTPSTNSINSPSTVNNLNNGSTVINSNVPVTNSNNNNSVRSSTITATPILSTSASTNRNTNSFNNNNSPTTSTSNNNGYRYLSSSTPTSNNYYFVDDEDGYNYSSYYPSTISNTVTSRNSDYEDEEEEEEYDDEEDDHSNHHRGSSSRSHRSNSHHGNSNSSSNRSSRGNGNSNSNSRRSTNYIDPDWYSPSTSTNNVLSGMRYSGSSNRNSNSGSSRTTTSSTIDWLLRGSGYGSNDDEDEDYYYY